MPLVAHCDLPVFAKLEQQGEHILSKQRASQQEIRELHIGLLNLMPDAALEATERQFFRLIGRSNMITQFFVYPFTLPEIKRDKKTNAYIAKHYQSFLQIKEQGLDALIISGAPVICDDLEQELFYQSLTKVIDWAYNNVTSTLCSCLATHVVMQQRYGQKRQPLPEKYWGVYAHKVVAQHPLVNGINTVFDVPHSRFNDISSEQFEKAQLSILVRSQQGVHLAVSEDLFRLVLFQGHPEYDTVSLLKEYKREVLFFIQGQRLTKPPFPQNYLTAQAQAILDEYFELLKQKKVTAADFPEQLLCTLLENSWQDSASAVINNWVGCVYQVTNHERGKPFMSGIDTSDPLSLKRLSPRQQ